MHIFEYIIDFLVFINPWGKGNVTTIELLQNDIQNLLEDKNKLRLSLYKIKDLNKEMDLQYQKVIKEKDVEIIELTNLIRTQEEALNLWMNDNKLQINLIEEYKIQLLDLLEWKRKATTTLNTYDIKNKILLKNNKSLLEELEKYKKD